MAEEHLQLVTKECSSYRAAVEESKQQARATFKAPDGSFQPPPVNCDIKPASNAISMHYSFDLPNSFIIPAILSNPDPSTSRPPGRLPCLGSVAKQFPDRLTLLLTRLLMLARGRMQLSACLTTSTIMD